jgi:hypothetical protein
LEGLAMTESGAKAAHGSEQGAPSKVARALKTRVAG